MGARFLCSEPDSDVAVGLVSLVTPFTRAVSRTVETESTRVRSGRWTVQAAPVTNWARSVLPRRYRTEVCGHGGSAKFSQPLPEVLARALYGRCDSARDQRCHRSLVRLSRSACQARPAARRSGDVRRSRDPRLHLRHYQRPRLVGPAALE